METVARIASRVILVLHVGSVDAVANVQRNITMIASKLEVSEEWEKDLRVLEGGEGNREAVVHVVGSVHLSLLMRGIVDKNALVSRILDEEDGETVTIQIRALQ